MRVDGFIFLAYDCHIQVHYSDLNQSTYAKAIFIVGLCSYRLLYIKNVFMSLGAVRVPVIRKGHTQI